jgi:hypothetical protein
VSEAYPALSSLRDMLRTKREEHKETLAAGRPEDKHYELVGQCKALQWVIDRVGEQIKQINSGDDDGSDDEN